MGVGVAVIPGTHIDVVFPYFEIVDLILVLMGEPGFGGQKVMLGMMGKGRERCARKPIIDIQIDRGLNFEMSGIVADAGQSCWSWRDFSND
jgi:ribulose-phosphate 3-epimerase